MALRKRHDGQLQQGGQDGVPSRTQPIDLAHLARQTMGDRAIEEEVLRLFAQQLEGVKGRLSLLAFAERRTLAHTIKGAAGGVGAFALADCAAAIEDDPTDTGLDNRFERLAEEVAAFIATMLR